MKILSGFHSERTMAAPENYGGRAELVLLCALLGALGICWLAMGVYVTVGRIRKKKLAKSRGND